MAAKQSSVIADWPEPKLAVVPIAILARNIKLL
jgi:hypothetical protein